MQKLKHFAKIITVTFVFTLIFSGIISQVLTGALTETRKSALVETLSGLQLDDGSFGTTDFPGNGCLGSTAIDLIVLKTLNALNKVNVEKAVEFLLSQQDPDSGAFGKLLGYNNTFLGFDLYLTYLAVKALKLLDELDRINRTALVNFVLERYNWSDGGFHELTVTAFGREYAISTFPILFKTESRIAYANSNIISTFLGVSILSELGELDKINVTKTLAFTMSCQTINGAFAPFPGASSEYQYLPGWSRLIRNPFSVDGQGAGIPYTYAAIGTLKVLGYLNMITDVDREKLLAYLAECQLNDTFYKGVGSGFGGFYIHRGAKNSYRYSITSFYTYQAFMTLYYLDMLEKAEEIVAKIITFVFNQQDLLRDNSWPIPRGREYLNETQFGHDWYGLFYGHSCCPEEGTDFAVEILNATNNLESLADLTPRAKEAIKNLAILSFMISVATVIVDFAVSLRKSNLYRGKIGEKLA